MDAGEFPSTSGRNKWVEYLHSALPPPAPAHNGLRTMIPLIGLIDDSRQAEVKCKLFEDNSGGLIIATLPKIWPDTKTSAQNTGISVIIWNKVKYQYTHCKQRIKSNC